MLWRGEEERRREERRDGGEGVGVGEEGQGDVERRVDTCFLTDPLFPILFFLFYRSKLVI